MAIYNNWHVFEDTHKPNETKRKFTTNDGLIREVIENHPKMTFRSYGNTGTVFRSPVITVTPENKLSMTNGCNIVFNLESGMKFDSDEYPGYVSFAFYDGETCMGKDREYAIADDLLYSTHDEMYYRKSEAEFKPQNITGPLGTALWKHFDSYGFALTLYPSPNVDPEHTKLVSYFKLSVKNHTGTYTSPYSDTMNYTETVENAELVKTSKGIIVYEDSLPEDVDLSKKSSISITRWREQIKIILNGMEVISFTPDKDSELANMFNSSCYFSMSCMGKTTSASNFSICSLNGIAATEYNY